MHQNNHFIYFKVFSHGSTFVLFFSECTCTIFSVFIFAGIFGIIQSMDIRRAKERGDLQTAKLASQRAMTFLIATIGVGVCYMFIVTAIFGFKKIIEFGPNPPSAS